MRIILFTLSLLIFHATAGALELLPAQEILPEVTALGVDVRVEKLVDPRFESLYEDEDKYYLNIEFGQLSLTQYNQIRALFGDKSKVPYDSGRKYNLIDFLPPSIQAVVNQVYIPQFYDLEFMYNSEPASEDDELDFYALRKSGFGNSTNCWNTTIENLNLILFPEMKNYSLYTPDRWSTNDFLKSDLSSDVISESEIKLWDVLLVSQTEFDGSEFAQIQHSALILNDNLIFEKTDSSENDPYRIALRKDVVQKYERFFEDRVVFEYRRFGKAPIPPIGSDENPKSSLSDALVKLLKDNGIKADFSQITSGCEDRLGGGCDLFFQEIEKTEVKIYSKTQRGILYGPSSVLDRFQPLKGE